MSFRERQMNVPSSKVKGRLGMNYVERIALQAGCKPIPVPEDLDTGIDGFIEFDDDGGRTKVVAFQVKRGSSFFDSTGPNHQTDARHLRYWIGYTLPVLLIVVREDESEAFWMDVQQHVKDNPAIIDKGPYVLRPPSTQTFTRATLSTTIRVRYAREYAFGDAVSALSAEAPETRLSSLSLLYRFRFERRAIFCIAGALRVETDPVATAEFCNFFSRYLSHPESGFGADATLEGYAASLLVGYERTQLLKILASFNDEEHYGDWDGATELFNCSEDEIWDRYSVIERGTVQQGIAEVVRAAASPDELLSILSDQSVPIQERRSAVALFGYLDFSCALEQLDAIVARETDPPLLALLVWLRYWIAKERK
jgi:hypothetical protein